MSVYVRSNSNLSEPVADFCFTAHRQQILIEREPNQAVGLERTSRNIARFEFHAAFCASGLFAEQFDNLPPPRRLVREDPSAK